VKVTYQQSSLGGLFEKNITSEMSEGKREEKKALY